jgi:two-component system, cell cycle sensor histidine kinase and response regulator CckA
LAPGVLLEEVAALLRPSLPARVGLVALDGTEGRRVPVDPVQVHRILMNLARNARLAMEDGVGTITLEMGLGEGLDRSGACGGATAGEDRLPTHLLIRVSDTGVGMDAETLRRAPDPFFTTRPTGCGRRWRGLRSRARLPWTWS